MPKNLELAWTLFLGVAVPAVVLPTGIASAQVPEPTAPASKFSPRPAKPGPVVPTFAMVPLGLYQSACQKEVGCGCSNGLDACIAGYTKANIEPATAACVAHQGCDALCEKPAAGPPGTKLHAACLTPEALSQAKVQFKENAILALCANARRCGCDQREPKTCAEAMIKSAPDVSGAFFACAAAQPCDAMCDPNTSKPGGAISTRCGQPEAQAAADLTAKTTAMIIQMSTAMQQQMHRTTMGIIRNMAPTQTRVDVYDAQGNFLRSE